MNADPISDNLHLFNFAALFIEELGWDRHRGSWPIRIIEPGQRNLGPGTQHGQGPRLNTARSISFEDLVQQIFAVEAVAQKKGVQILHCKPPLDGKVPNYPTRCRIQHQVAKLARENVVIFTNQSRTHQIWQWVRRATGESLQYCEHEYWKTDAMLVANGGQAGDDSESLDQRLRHLVFSMADEERLTLTEVAQRLRKAFYIFRSKSRRGPYSTVRLYEYDFEELSPSVQFWVEQVYAEPRLSRAAEFDLARRITAGDHLAREKFIRANLYLVAEIAWRLCVDNNLSDDEFLDLVQRGNILLVRLADKFDPAHGARFQAFASLRLSSRLSYAVLEAKCSCYLPRYQLERLSQLLRLWDEAEETTLQRLERQPTHLEIAAEVAAQMSLPPLAVAHLHQMAMPAESWDFIHLEWDAVMDDEALENSRMQRDESIPHFLNDPWTNRDAAVNLIRREQLEAALNNLTPRERSVVWMRFGLEDGCTHTLEEVGQRFAITRERVRQIELRALKKLRRMGPVDITAGTTPEKACTIFADQLALSHGNAGSDDTALLIDDDAESAI